MSADTTAPELTHVRFAWDGNTNDPGKLHTRKNGQNGQVQKSVGWVRGSGIRIGHTVQVMKNRNKGWDGAVVSGPQPNAHGQLFWTFEVVSLENSVDPIEDDTITVTVTNPGPPAATSNPPLSSDPQPNVVP